jgi:hypothetical protein
MRIIQSLVFLASLFLLVSCMADDKIWNFEKLEVQSPYKGLFITNEGNFMYGNASLSYYDMATKEC